MNQNAKTIGTVTHGITYKKHINCTSRLYMIQD